MIREECGRDEVSGGSIRGRCEVWISLCRAKRSVHTPLEGLVVILSKSLRSYDDNFWCEETFKAMSWGKSGGCSCMQCHTSMAIVVSSNPNPTI